MADASQGSAVSAQECTGCHFSHAGQHFPILLAQSIQRLCVSAISLGFSVTASTAQSLVHKSSFSL